MLGYGDKPTSVQGANRSLIWIGKFEQEAKLRHNGTTSRIAEDKS